MHVTLERLLSPFIRKIICVSRFDYYKARSVGIPASKMCIIHHGMRDLPYHAPSFQSVPINVIMVAHFSPPKDHKKVIQAMQGVPKATLWLVGDGELLPSAQGYADQLDVAVRFWGQQSNVPYFLQQAQIFVLSSQHEGLPLSIIEAMRAGLPIVASNVGGIPELVWHGVNGYLVPHNDVGALARAIRRLADDASLRAYMGEMSRQLYLERFSEAGMVARTESVYRELYQSPQSVP